MEFCPVCMLHMALADDVESGESSSERAAKLKSQGVARRFQHYELLIAEDGRPVELGRGAMGVTYKAFDVDLRCPVTLKVISEKHLGDESARLRFLREARAAASVRHPNVASVFHLGKSGGNYFYAMEFVEGETLENLVRRTGRLEVKLALEVVAQVAGGLAAVHKKGLVHRDIKPSNIMVNFGDEGAVTAKIIDLGHARNRLGRHLSLRRQSITAHLWGSHRARSGFYRDGSVGCRGSYSFRAAEVRNILLPLRQQFRSPRSYAGGVLIRFKVAAVPAPTRCTTERTGAIRTETGALCRRALWGCPQICHSLRSKKPDVKDRANRLDLRYLRP